MSEVRMRAVVWLDNSRIIAVFAVILLHTAGIVVNESDLGSEYWWIGNFYDSLVRWCVPVFLMISGALLLDPSKNEDLGTFYMKRASRILVPVLFWSALFLLWAIVKGGLTSLADLLGKLLSGRAHYHMWFLYMIIPLYLFAPFLRKITANSTRSETAILVILAFLLAAVNAISASPFPGGSRLFVNWFLSYIPYFFLGYLVRTSKHSVSKLILWAVFLLSSLLTAFGYYILATNKDLDTGLYFYKSLSITVIPMSVSVIYLLRSWSSPIIREDFTRTLSSLVLGVYLVHPVFLDTIKDLGYSPVNYYPAVSIPIITVIVFSLSLVGSWMISNVPYLKHTI